jgi:microsomal epoxide hydrolase
VDHGASSNEEGPQALSQLNDGETPMPAPFAIDVPDAVITDLNARLAAARLPPMADDKGWEDGADPVYLRELIGYWRDGFDWRAQETALNRFAHFRAEVDGTAVHFIHERGKGPAPLPILLLHGYPDSFHRFIKLIPILTDPAAHGGDPADAFDVVAPSLPGYGFSEPRRQGGGAFGFGEVMHRLMTDTLGYDRYAAHGGDWGGVVTELLARSHAAHLIGIHMTDVPFFHIFRKPDELSPAEKTFFDKNRTWQREEGAYAMIQGTQPRTAGPALNDSPAGLAAWIVEKFQRWCDCDGDIETRFTKDELLTNIMIYWATQTIESSFQPYRDFMKAGPARWTAEAVKDWIGSDATPAAFARFPADISHPPREWAERFFNVQRWTEMPAGGHFAAFEEPELLADDIRAFFRPLRMRRAA